MRIDGNTAGSYPDYRRPCGWNALLPGREVSAALDADTRCDVAIVGAGYTGVAAARRFAELRPDADIVLIDASYIGEGNPGRNSGFLLEVALASDADAGQLERMALCNRLIGTTMQQIVADVQASRIDCGLRRSGTYRAAAGDGGIDALHRYRRFLEATGLPSEVLDRRQLAERLGTHFYRQGLYSPHCYLAQPAALMRALASRLPCTVRLFERTPALRLRQRSGGFEIATPGGSIRADRVMLANNAFCKQLGVGRSRIVAMYTYAALTQPLSDAALRQLGSKSEWGLLPAHRLGSTLRRTADGRLLIRSLYGYERESNNTKIAERLREALIRRFPELPLPPFEAVWSGATGFTLNGSPLWGEVRPGLFVSAGCNGGGIVKGTLFGQLLADRALGHHTPDVASLFGRARRMPPEPLRTLGFKVIAALERRSARAEV